MYAPRNAPTVQKHIMTVSVEDYFHVAALRGAILRKHWDRLEPHLDRNLDDILEMFERFKARATFFVLGLIAEMQPEVVSRIVQAGHEVAQGGYWPRSLEGITEAEFRKELARTRRALEEAGAGRPVGYRSPTWMRTRNAWMLDVLIEEGYAYDSSVNPVFRRFAGMPDRDRIHKHRHASRNDTLWEFPITSVGALGLRIPITGGNYLRQLPHTLLTRLVDGRTGTGDPLVFYFMPWEMDQQQPAIQGISRLQRMRHYRNLGKTRWVIEHYLETLPFHGIADHLGLPYGPPAGDVERARVRLDTPAEVVTTGEPVSLVVPMFNEEMNVRYLHRTLMNCRSRFAGRYRLHLVLVDDCSTDGTWKMLHEVFATTPDCQLVRHETNKGVAAAIITGLRAATTEIVCSIDCDCSYDPYVFEEMIPRIEGADLVTASPYHPSGHVLNVPSWRLFLSKTLSRMYSGVLEERFYTYTSCCRVYRRSKMIDLPIENGGFLGVAEMLIRLKLAGGRIVEHPATLESRLLGHSKMKVAKTIKAHLGLLRKVSRGQASDEEGDES